MKRGSEKKLNRHFSKFGPGTEMRLEEEYVELFQPKEEPIDYGRFTDGSE
jgi:hypothetical protein